MYFNKLINKNIKVFISFLVPDTVISGYFFIGSVSNLADAKIRGQLDPNLFFLLLFL